MDPSHDCLSLPLLLIAVTAYIYVFSACAEPNTASLALISIRVIPLPLFRTPSPWNLSMPPSPSFFLHSFSSLCTQQCLFLHSSVPLSISPFSSAFIFPMPCPSSWGLPSTDSVDAFVCVCVCVCMHNRVSTPVGWKHKQQGNKLYYSSCANCHCMKEGWNKRQREKETYR